MTILNIDCIDYMKGLDDNAFDLAICDPPYGLKRFSKGGSFVNKYGEPGLWNNNKPDANYFSELFRVSRIQIIWGANNFDLPNSEYFIVWDKSMTGKHDFAECEMAWVGGDIKKPAKIIQIKAQSTGEKKIHPTQKPVELGFPALYAFTEKGDIILDCFGGSGSTLIAAEEYKRKAYVLELDPYYCSIIIQRWEDLTGKKAKKT